jgi:chaperonin GroEL
MNIREFKQEWFGKAKSVKVKKEETIIVSGAGDPKEIKARIETIKKEIENTTSSYDKEKLNERLAKLAGGVAVIRVGASYGNRDEREKIQGRRRLDATKAPWRKELSRRRTAYITPYSGCRGACGYSSGR